MSEIIDFHSHVLPGIDDGSASLEESIAMLKMEAAQGITHVVATPHFYPRYDSPEKFLARRDEAERALRDEMAKHSGLPRLSVGAEVYFFKGIGDSDILKELTIDSNGCILLEMPDSDWTTAMYREIENIPGRLGLTPVVAHVDRYISPLRTHGIPEALERLPVLVQANASFFLRPFTRGMALRMLRNDQIQLLGSDCHNMTSRLPNLGDALKVIEKSLGAAMIQQIEDNQEGLLSVV